MNTRTLELLGAGAVALWGMAEGLVNMPDWQVAGGGSRQDALAQVQADARVQPVASDQLRAGGRHTCPRVALAGKGDAGAPLSP